MRFGAASGSLVLLMMAWSASLQAQVVERRRDQFPKEPYYLVLPLPYSYPGIGSGMALTVYAGKPMHQQADLYVSQIFGDAEGTLFGVSDIHLLDRRLLFEVNGEVVSKAALGIYNQRGMDAGKDEYRYALLRNSQSLDGTLTLSLWDRRLELRGSVAKSSQRLAEILDQDGNSIAQFDPVQLEESWTRRLGILVDLTDDRADPRRGFRGDFEFAHSPRTDEDTADTIVSDISLSAYVPFGQRNTWAFNLFRSDAHVLRQGETDPERIRRTLGFACSADDANCLKAEADKVAMVREENGSGTASSLGGPNGLQAYPRDRFKSAHAMMLRTEFRWNMTEDFSPVDYWIWKDVVANIQLAPFYEAGLVANEEANLWNADQVRHVVGLGLHLISASGMVYRADYAYGDEGGQPVLFVHYSW